ncbi:hypothetical protein ACH42_00050 [Endozoicomonas sp. (ex Bugula neritina AB1)]|nr:hypothetical protein ACH42_00050 [Endozoicomonas sp. (ex Bugula neritina AB1)]
MHKILPLFILMVLAGCCESTHRIPVRPANISHDAVWAGGSDGGHWFLCKDESYHQYQCNIYNDYDGYIAARGRYTLRSVTWDEKAQKAVYKEAASEPKVEFNYYDGKVIHLMNGLTLIPDGVIDYPFDETSGKKQEYKQGEAVSEEVQYQK